jgi:regulator of replication initiation timing
MNNIDEILQENQSLKIKNQELEHKLQKYTNSEGHKRYYEKNTITFLTNRSIYYIFVINK